MPLCFQDLAGLEHYKWSGKGKWLYGLYFPFSFQKTCSIEKQVKVSEDYSFTNLQRPPEEKKKASKLDPHSGALIFQRLKLLST